MVEIPFRLNSVINTEVFSFGLFNLILSVIVIDIYYYKVRLDKPILPGMLSSLGVNWG